jgi:hypothetical protein
VLVAQWSEARVDIRELRPSEFVAAARLLTRAMHENPIDVAVFGPDPDRRQRVLFPFFRRELTGLAGRGLLIGAFVRHARRLLHGPTGPLSADVR